MRFEWDEAKRRANIEKHGLDFILAASLFDGRPVVTAPSLSKDEERFASVSQIEGRFFTVIWCWRGENIRIISARRSRDAEQKRYTDLHG